MEKILPVPIEQEPTSEFTCAEQSLLAEFITLLAEIDIEQKEQSQHQKEVEKKVSV